MLRPLAVTTFLASLGCAVAAVAAPDADQRGLLGASGGLGATSALISFAADSKTRGKYKPISDVEAFVAKRRKEAAEKVKAAEKEIQLRQAGAEADLRAVTGQIASKASKLESAEQRLRRLDKDVLAKEKDLLRINGDLSRIKRDIEDEYDLSDSGFAARRYIGLDSRRLSDKLKQNREQQKKVGKNLLAKCKNSQVTLEGSAAKGRAFVRQTLKALLRGFNGECDAAISTLKHSNDSTVLGKIDRAFQFYAKQAKDRVSMPWSSSLLDLKVDEAYLVHENALAKQAEREEQTELRRQEREEARARQEAEAAQEAAEREAEKFAELLARAKAEAAQVIGLFRKGPRKKWTPGVRCPESINRNSCDFDRPSARTASGVFRTPSGIGI